MIIQELWKRNFSWDELLDDVLQRQVSSWRGETQVLQDLVFPRRIGYMNKPVTIHMFSDASEKACGCSIYVATDSEAFLIFAKAKVASLKSESLARLEPQAAFVGTRALRIVLLETKLIACEVHARSES